MRRTASSASGEMAPGVLPCALRRAFSATSAKTKNGRRACTQQAASTIGPRFAIGLVQLVISAISVSLENPGVTGEMRLGMLARAVARIIEHRRRRRCAAERAIVAHINPTSPGIRLALGQDRNGGVVAMQSFGGEDMRFQTPEERFEHGAAGSNLVGQGRQAERHAFLGIAFGLAVERLMLPELLEQNHRQKSWDRPSPWRSHGTALEPG